MPPATVTSEAAVPAIDGARFESLLLEFLAYLELERGLSRNTLNAYRTDLLQYGDYLREHGIDRSRVAFMGYWRQGRAENS